MVNKLVYVAVAVLVLVWLWGVYELSGASSWGATTTTLAANLSRDCHWSCEYRGFDFYSFNEEVDAGQCWCWVNRSRWIVKDVW